MSRPVHLRLALVILSALTLSSCTERGGAGEADPGKEPAKPATAEPAPLRVEVAVTEDGYRPLEVDAKAGVPLTMVFTRTTEEECGKKVVVPDFGIERDLPVNVPVEIAFTPERTGRIGFMCGMGKMRGAILVQ